MAGMPPQDQESLTEQAEATVEVVGSMAEICPVQWNECANPAPATHNPFISHAFLRALEDAETVAPRTGWQPQHLIIKDSDDTIKG